MRVSVPVAAMESIRSEAEAGYPYEICGFLLGSRESDALRVDEARPAGNARTDSAGTTRYRIEPDVYRAVEREADRAGSEIVGFYHSHPDAPARPSEYDLDHAWPSVAYLIVSVREGEAGEATGWRLTDDRTRFDPIELEIAHDESTTIPKEEDPCPTS